MKIIKLVSILFAFVITGCDILENEEGELRHLDSKINFKVIESYEVLNKESKPKLYMEMETEKSYPCMNYSIQTSNYIGENSFQIDIDGIYKPGVCLTAFGPAESRIELGDIDSGIFEIKIKSTKFSDKYNLMVTDSLIILDGEETVDTKAELGFIWRYPKNSFVFFNDTTNADRKIGEGFLDTLNSELNLSEFTFQAFAKDPYRMQYSGYYNNSIVAYYTYNSESDFDRIKDIMKNYKTEHFPDNNKVNLVIINWMNGRIRSKDL